ncbi:MAG: hypothetical protein ACR2NA_12945 [Solirubrobacterales bacterium]
MGVHRQRGSRGVRGIRALLGAALLVVAMGAPSAQAAIPQTLKDACETQTAAPGYEYRFCDDGVPDFGGRDPNPTGAKAITVPAKYDGFAGLPAKAADAATAPGANALGDVALDVNVSLPPASMTPPAGGFPVMTLVHGCCSGNKTSWEAQDQPEGERFDKAGKSWHYNNAWYAARGYVVITYTSRGFVDNQNDGSTGESQLDHRAFEINDFQHMAGQLADDPFFSVNPAAIVPGGGSYGGGFAWMAFTDPTWKSPGGKDMSLAAAAPRYGWTDLAYSLVPTGRQGQRELPPTDGGGTLDPPGMGKQSIVAALFATGVNQPADHATFPSSIADAFLCLQTVFPYEQSPLCQTALGSTLPTFVFDRSAYYQNEFFSRIESDPAARTPLFSSGTTTDPLFPQLEHRRMVKRLKQAVPDYPVQEYYGDYQHFVQDKDKEWGDICANGGRHVCRYDEYPQIDASGRRDVDAEPAGFVELGATTRLDRFVDHYAKPPGNASEPQPEFDVTAALQVCPQNASDGQPADEPGPRFTAPSFGELAPNTLTLELSGEQTTTSTVPANPHAVAADPVGNFAARDGACPLGDGPAGAGVATFDSEPLGAAATMIGPTRLAIDYAVGASAAGARSAQAQEAGLQLNTRMYDVSPDGTAIMVDRGPRRLDSETGPVATELHGAAYRFEEGHRIRFEIAQDDAPFVKASTVPSSITVSGVAAAIPVRETQAPPSGDPGDDGSDDDTDADGGDDADGDGGDDGAGSSGGGDGGDRAGAGNAGARDVVAADSDTLAFTGMQLAVPAGLGLALAACGLGLAMVSRRRTT